MRLCILFLFCSLSLTHAADTYAQKTKISIDVNHQTVETVLNQIKAKTGFDFFFNNKHVDLNRRVSVAVNEGNVFQVLTKVFEGTNVKYSILDKKIVLTVDEAHGVQQNAAVKITGKVVDSSGEPIIGASVVEKGTTNGLVTDLEGAFTLMMPTTKSELIVSYIGYQTQTIKPQAGKSMLITLNEDNELLEEVVIVGFGTQKKVNLTGAVGTVTDEVLQSRPITNATQALQGVLPGLNVSMTSAGGELNNGMKIDIRGAGTIGSGSKSSPLILIDGMDGDINALNPQDIESITVLKDAAAASVYGSRASFGVILVTTKKGKAGKTSVTYNGSFRWLSPTRMPEMMDSYTFANYWNLAGLNSNQGVIFDEETMGRIIAFQKGEITTQSVPDANNPNFYQASEKGNNNIDWMKKHYKSSTFAQEQNLTVSGGSEKVQYYISANYLDQNGLLRYGNDNFKRYAFSTKINAQLASWASVNVSTKFNRSDTDQPQFLTDQSRLFYQGLSRIWPTTPFDYDHGGNTYSTYIPALRDGGRAKTQDDYLYQQVQLILEPIKNWKIFAEGNYRTRNLFVHNEVLPTKEVGIDGVNFNMMPVGSYATGLSRITEKGYNENFFNTNVYTEYGQTLNKVHTYKVMVGFNAELNNDRGIQAYRDGLITTSLPTINTATGADKITDGSYNHWATAGFFGRINYNYKERYLLEANLRYDGTSRFLAEKRWNWFPSFSAGWNIARESFMEPISQEISMLKLRASFGTLGNQNTESLYPFYSLVPITASGSSWLLNGTNPNKILPAALISRYLTWEKVESWNIGVDFGFLNNRLTGSFDWFNRYTRNMVGPAPEMPLTLGTDVPKMNNANLKTTGWELSLSWRDQLNNGLGYGVRFTVADARSKIMKYPNESNNIRNYDDGTKIYHVGQYLGEIWGYTTIGIAKTVEEMNAHLAKVNQTALGSEWTAGDIMYADLDKSGEINGGKSVLGDMGDKKIIGNDTPRYNFGLTLDGNWKGFDASIFFQGTMKRDLWLGSPQLWGAQSKWHGMGLKAHEDYFRLADDPMGENLNAYYPRPIFDTDKNRQIQTRYLQNGAYIRLKNIQLGYTLPLVLSQKAAIQKLRIFVSAENLWTATSLSKAFDPESFSGDQGAGRTYPLQSTISLGLNVNF